MTADTMARGRIHRAKYGRRLARFNLPLGAVESDLVKEIGARLRVKHSRVVREEHLKGHAHIYSEHVEFWLEEGQAVPLLWLTDPKAYREARRAEKETRTQLAATTDEILAENPPEEKTYTSKAVPKRKRVAG